jgi:hypothetical protein
MNREQPLAAAIIGALWLAAPGCSSTPSGPTSMGPFVVVGQVLDFQSHAGVPGATVSFGDVLSPAVLPGDPRSITDGGGAYQLALMPGQYHVWIDDNYRGEVVIRNGVNRTDLLVRDGGCAVRYGTIADARTGQPVAGATVSLTGVTAVTAADGSYRLDFGCRGPFAFAGTIDMLVNRAGYETRSVPAGRGENLINAIRQDADLTPQ